MENIFTKIKNLVTVKIPARIDQKKWEAKCFLRRHKVIDRIVRIITGPFKNLDALGKHFIGYNADLAGIFLDTYFIRKDECKTMEGRKKWQKAKEVIGCINMIAMTAIYILSYRYAFNLIIQAYTMVV